MANVSVKYKIIMYNDINNVVGKVIIRGVSNMNDVNELLNEAIKETANLKEEEIFLVKELFKGYEWNRIPRSERILLGTLFLHHINKGTTSIKAIQKTTSGQQKYQITKSKGV